MVILSILENTWNPKESIPIHKTKSLSELQVDHYPSKCSNKHVKGKKYHTQAKNKYLEF